MPYITLLDSEDVSSSTSTSFVNDLDHLPALISTTPLFDLMLLNDSLRATTATFHEVLGEEAVSEKQTRILETYERKIAEELEETEIRSCLELGLDILSTASTLKFILTDENIAEKLEAASADQQAVLKEAFVVLKENLKPMVISFTSDFAKIEVDYRPEMLTSFEKDTTQAVSALSAVVGGVMLVEAHVRGQAMSAFSAVMDEFWKSIIGRNISGEILKDLVVQTEVAATQALSFLKQNLTAVTASSLPSEMEITRYPQAANALANGEMADASLAYSKGAIDELGISSRAVRNLGLGGAAGVSLAIGLAIPPILKSDSPAKEFFQQLTVLTGSVTGAIAAARWLAGHGVRHPGVLMLGSFAGGMAGAMGVQNFGSIMQAAGDFFFPPAFADEDDLPHGLNTRGLDHEGEGGPMPSHFPSDPTPPTQGGSASGTAEAVGAVTGAFAAANLHAAFLLGKTAQAMELAANAHVFARTERFSVLVVKQLLLAIEASIAPHLRQGLHSLDSVEKLHPGLFLSPLMKNDFQKIQNYRMILKELAGITESASRKLRVIGTIGFGIHILSAGFAIAASENPWQETLRQSALLAAAGVGMIVGGTLAAPLTSSVLLIGAASIAGAFVCEWLAKQFFDDPSKALGFFIPQAHAAEPTISQTARDSRSAQIEPTPSFRALSTEISALSASAIERYQEAHQQTLSPELLKKMGESQSTPAPGSEKDKLPQILEDAFFEYRLSKAKDQLREESREPARNQSRQESKATSGPAAPSFQMPVASQSSLEFPVHPVVQRYQDEHRVTLSQDLLRRMGPEYNSTPIPGSEKDKLSEFVERALFEDRLNKETNKIREEAEQSARNKSQQDSQAKSGPATPSLQIPVASSSGFSSDSPVHPAVDRYQQQQQATLGQPVLQKMGSQYQSTPVPGSNPIPQVLQDALFVQHLNKATDSLRSDARRQEVENFRTATANVILETPDRLLEIEARRQADGIGQTPLLDKLFDRKSDHTKEERTSNQSAQESRAASGLAASTLHTPVASSTTFSSSTLSDSPAHPSVNRYQQEQQATLGQHVLREMGPQYQSSQVPGSEQLPQVLQDENHQLAPQDSLNCRCCTKTEELSNEIILWNRFTLKQ